MIVKTEHAFIRAFAAAVGKKEGEGPLGRQFDYVDTDDRFGQPTWEMAESECARLALSLALAKLPDAAADLLIAGDLQNQCVSSAYGLLDFEIPYLGIYGACSNLTEGMALGAMLLSGGAAKRVALVTSSHNCAAERQFRSPIEYGGQRTPTAQWTVTGAGGYILDAAHGDVRICDCLIGRVQDVGLRDLTDMGAAMAPAAADTLFRYFEESGTRPEDYDAVITGDLGAHGSLLLGTLCRDRDLPLENHFDCGNLIYDASQDVHAGGSGCGCSATVLGAKFLPMLGRGELSSVLMLATGALMSKDSVAQGRSIPAIAHLVHLAHR
ncbi:MAG: stage V sporulation protein AD [Clostridia bacterium]|nr:stage V sporulation protein AD [Clostridia bacterium]